jgi:hypothetical protein
LKFHEKEGSLTTESTEKGERVSHNEHDGHNEKQNLEPSTTEAQRKDERF